MARNKTVVLGYLKDRVCKCLQGWEGRLLFRVGKDILIKTIVQALPNYAMSIFLLQLEISRDIESQRANFWWQSSSDSRKGIHWLSWEKLCKHKRGGGMSFRNLWDFNLALLRLILGILLQITEVDDHYIWAMETSGLYTFKSVYALLQKLHGQWVVEDASGFWSKFWSLKLPPNIKNLTGDGVEHWTLPNGNSIKVNVGVTLFHEGQAYGLGMVARDSRGGFKLDQGSTMEPSDCGDKLSLCSASFKKFH
uniref:Uncharacterized protein n=1 Tax=Cannabis sativa TaxID=3483 RepID=A0A803QGI2_CANSA